MKEIKFRRAHFDEDGFTGYTYWGKINHKGEYSEDCFSSPTWRSGTLRTIDEQYTGLKDKNGVEIYKGDIFLFANSLKNTIVFKEGMFCYDSMEAEEDLENLVPLNNYHFKWVNNQSSRIEVIGNIHY